MNKPEQWFWRNRLRRVLASIPGLHYDRVESRTSNGTPDIHICTPAGFGWIEMKVGRLKRDRLHLPTLSAIQDDWIVTRGKMTGRVWLVVWEDDHDEVFLFDHKGMHFVQNGHIPIDASIKRNPSREDWMKILL